MKPSSHFNFLHTTVLVTLALIAGCAGEDDPNDAGIVVDGGTDANSLQDAGLGRDSATPDSGPAISCSFDIDCPEGFSCDQESFVCAPSDPSRCSLSTCEEGIASNCEGDVVVLCGDHGGSCAQFEDPFAGTYSWCDCGTIGAGEFFCTGERSAVFCADGVFAEPAECPVGTICLNDNGDASCFCDDIPDGICPDPSCIFDLDCEDCVPDCDGLECGGNGCGGSCGSCALGQACVAGTCSCVPQCTGRECGADGCGGVCGTCSGSERCAGGTCMGDCPGDCSGRSCGSDGCGGSCGSCAAGQSCNDGGECVTDCVPMCAGRECGSDNCSGSCGSCGGGESCEAGICVGSACGTGGTCESPASCTSVSTGGERCACLGSEEQYQFDGTALDFSGALRSARIEARQIYDNDTAAPRTSDSSNFRTTSNQTLRFGNACQAHVELTRVFTYVIDGSVQTCRIGPETYIGRSSFVLTMPSGTGSACTAPRL